MAPDEAPELPQLARAGLNLVQAATWNDSSITRTRFRDETIRRVLAALDRRRSILIVGEPGVGKTAIVHGVARAFLAAGGGQLHELSTTDIMTGTRFIGEWQTRVSGIMNEAMQGGVTLYIPDIRNLRSTGATSFNAATLWSAMAPRIKLREVTLIGELAPSEADLFLKAPNVAALFDRIHVDPLSSHEVEQIVAESAESLSVTLDDECRRELISLTSRFGTAGCQPRPALQLLGQVRDYQRQKEEIGEPEGVTTELIERVFSVYSGLPLFVVSRRAQISPGDLRRQLEETIVGQRDAIDAIVETITLFKAGLHDPGRPIGALLFVGPTGVGKTEVARTLARFFFGSERRLLRFDLSEYKDYHSFQMLVGSHDQPEGPAKLLDPVRTQPFQVLLLDELEKSHPNVHDLMLQVLDEGRLTPPRGKAVSFRNTIVIATSNTAAEGPVGQLGFARDAGPALDAEGIRAALERDFRPEFLNRFQHIVRFHPLTRDQVKIIARQELDRFVTREGIVSRDLIIDVSDEALDVAIDHGFTPRYGARALKREIQRRIVMPIAAALMERHVTPHMIVRLMADGSETKVRLIDTNESKALRAEDRAVALPDGRTLDRSGIAVVLESARHVIEQLAAEVGEGALRTKLEHLYALRAEGGFWSHTARALSVVREIESHQRTLDRIDRLRQWAADIAARLAETDRRREVEFAGQSAARIELAVASARRELLVLGPDGFWDAIVEIAPLGKTGQAARDTLVDTYSGWASDRRMTVDWVRRSLKASEPVMVTIAGAFASGYLRREAGLHRVTLDRGVSVARVRVAAWTDETADPTFTSQRAIKTASAERVRSRLECDTGLVIQNERTIEENRKLAAELVAPWGAAPPPSDVVVRRYELSPFLLKDVATGVTQGKRSASAGRDFHELLCARIDQSV